MHKITSISLKMVEVVILSENSCHFVSCSAANQVACKLNSDVVFSTKNVFVQKKMGSLTLIVISMK